MSEFPVANETIDSLKVQERPWEISWWETEKFCTILVVIGGIGVISSFFLLGFGKVSVSIGLVILITCIITVVCGAIGIYMYRFFDSHHERLNTISDERNRIMDTISEDEPNIFQTAQLSLVQIKEYHEMNKSQARRTFAVSIGSVLVGFATLILGAVLIYIRSAVTTGALTAIAGTLIQFFGGAQFLVYRKTLEQVNYFFTQLINVQDTLMAITLAEKIDAEELRGLAQRDIIVSLLQRSLKQYDKTVTT